MKRSLALGGLLAPLVSAQVAASNPAAGQPTAAIDPNLVGTWTTGSRTVFTGPGFYDPVKDEMKEPSLPGISYSFTSDGFYEEAYYRAVANPTKPDCASSIIQWQHGTFIQLANGSLSLTPFADDGRQQQSTPCDGYGQSVYSRYNQPEFIKEYQVIKPDPYHGINRLNLYKFDGSPMIPMYIAYSPTPQMLPTVTMNPTSSATGASSTSASKVKRGLEETLTGRRTNVIKPRSALMDPDKWYWFGISATAIGTVAYFFF